MSRFWTAVRAIHVGTGAAGARPGAFSRLRAHARNHNLRLTDAAQAATDRTLDPAAWTRPPRPVPS